MKKVVLSLIILLTCVFDGFCGRNRTLEEAQALFQSATTIEQYETAKRKFASARYDIMYNAEEHDLAINDGIKKCDDRIYELTPRLTVNGNDNSVGLKFVGAGGSKTLSISTNQGVPTTSSLPSWITVTSTSSSSMTIKCNANNTPSSRNDWFTINAGSKSVRVNVAQSVAPKLEISKIEFANVQKDGTIINNYGAALYSAGMRYLQPKMVYGGLISSQTKTVNIKVIKPDGTLLSGTSSPAEYSQSFNITLSSGSANTYLLGSLGADNSSVYNAGVWKYEVWIDGKSVYATNVYIYSKETTYLKVNDQTSISTSFSADGGSKSYTISTDGDYWSTRRVPDFCMITNKTTSSFTLQCEPNTSSSSRSDYMKIMSGEKEVRIDISQAAAGPSAKIVSINQTHNIINGYVKGMNIVIKFETSHMKNKRATATAWFYYADNTTQLNNGYGGQVHISKSDTAPYEETTFTMTLFLPYSSLNMARGGDGTFSFDIVITDSKGKTLARKKNNTFTFSSF